MTRERESSHNSSPEMRNVLRRFLQYIFFKQLERHVSIRHPTLRIYFLLAEYCPRTDTEFKEYIRFLTGMSKAHAERVAQLYPEDPAQVYSHLLSAGQQVLTIHQGLAFRDRREVELIVSF